jgi:acyl dehydratase
MNFSPLKAMIVEERFFEDYAIGSTRQSQGRTITEADIVAHAGQTGDFFPTTWTRNGARRRSSSSVWPMERWFSA